MVMQEQDLLAERVAALEQTVADLAIYLRSALNYISSDPQSSLTKSRMTLEKLLLRLYHDTMSGDPRRPMIGEMLADKTFITGIPRRILARMNAVRDMSNLGPHGEHVEMTDAIRVMRDLVDVLEWYAVNFDPAMGSVATQKPRDAVELLPALRNKYQQYLRPDITSVKFVQCDGRCYLEMTTAEFVADYLHNETTRREDLGFIASAGGVMFNPADPILDNAGKFIVEMDEISIINCTDLFPRDIAARIDREWRTTRPPS